MRRANYSIVRDIPDTPLVIRDEGPWDVFATITNDAERVVRDLFQRGKLPVLRRLFYYDSEGNLDELIVRDGKFVAFYSLNDSERKVVNSFLKRKP